MPVAVLFLVKKPEAIWMYIHPQTKQYACDAVVFSKRIEQAVVAHSDPKTVTLSTRSQIQNSITYCIHFCETLGKAELLYTTEVDYWLHGVRYSYRGIQRTEENTLYVEWGSSYISLSFVQTHKTIQLKYMHHILCKLYFSKVAFQKNAYPVSLQYTLGVLI